MNISAENKKKLLESITNFITLEARYKVAYNCLHKSKANLSNELARKKTPKESLFFTALDNVTNWILEGDGEEFLQGVGLNNIIRDIKEISSDKLSSHLEELSNKILQEEEIIEKLIPHDGYTIMQMEELITSCLSDIDNNFDQLGLDNSSSANYWQNKIKS